MLHKTGKNRLAFVIYHKTGLAWFLKQIKSKLVTVANGLLTGF
jgi:hypothetical protein